MIVKKNSFISSTTIFDRRGSNLGTVHFGPHSSVHPAVQDLHHDQDEIIFDGKTLVSDSKFRIGYSILSELSEF